VDVVAVWKKATANITYGYRLGGFGASAGALQYKPFTTITSNGDEVLKLFADPRAMLHTLPRQQYIPCRKF